METTLLCVGPDHLAATFPLVADLLDSGYAASDHLMPPDLLGWLKRGEGLLWVVADQNRILAAVTSSVIQRRSGPVFRFWGGGGSQIELWIGHLSAIEDYARSAGCAKVVFEGRQGWGRRLAGYAPTTIAFEKVL